MSSDNLIGKTIIYRGKPNIAGWYPSWTPSMDEYINTPINVTSINENGDFRIKETGFSFPPFGFEILPSIKDLEKNDVIHCSTREEYDAICQLLHKLGKSWGSGDSYLKIDHFESYASETGLCPYEGNYCCIEAYKKDGRTIHPASIFINQKQTTEEMKFPITLNKEDAARIIEAACEEWKPKLADKWSTLLYEEDIKVTEGFYREMRKACTPEQHTLFDTIFGSDKQAVDFSILNKTDVFYIETEASKILSQGGIFNWDEKDTSYFYGTERVYNNLDGIVASKDNVLVLRKATQEEIALFQEKTNPFTKGDRVWVQNPLSTWHCRYYSHTKRGEHFCFYNQQKSGGVNNWEKCVAFDDVPF